MTFTRDPVSPAFTISARQILDRAYANPREWQTIWLPDPTIRQRTRYASVVTDDLTGPDPLPRGGGLDARTRWGRAFVRCLHFEHRNYSPQRGSSKWQRRAAPRSAGGLRIEIGRHVPGSKQFDPARPERGGLPPRRKVRVMLDAGGARKARAVDAKPVRDRTWVGDKEPGGRWAGGMKYADWA